MPLNLPNLVTLLRILLIPLIVGIFYLPDAWLSFEGKNILATGIFIFAAITDWLDGYLARKLDQMSAFGAFFDPVADKLVVVGALIVLLHLNRVDMVVALIIIGREIVISALREWMATLGHSKSVAVAFIGKLKTVLQMIAIIILLLQHRYAGRPLYEFGQYLLMAAAVITLWSGFVYLRAAWPLMRAEGVAG
ncbi:MAG: CDP-diacylglycerol--glycerol-3-phosphate 3-phosphatidyltransferase, partial [Candidatus Parcubacteria bacterium]|nr:CDP-diacylglycerol--glycerol-3-phosphate 3-phosphatidyltransferase [Burkholderiales bacterium]